jgi:hypothetical protein
VPGLQGDKAARRCGAQHPCSSHPLLSSLSGSGRAASSHRGRELTHPDSGGQVHQVGRGRAASVNFRGIMSRSAGSHSDHHHRPRVSIHFQRVGGSVRRLGIQHICTTAFHPQSNGLVEHFHRRLKEALKACLAGPAWPSHLPWVMLCLHAALGRILAYRR